MVKKRGFFYLTKKRKKVIINSNYPEFSRTRQWSERCDQHLKMCWDLSKKVIANQKKVGSLSVCQKSKKESDNQLKLRKIFQNSPHPPQWNESCDQHDNVL